MKIRLRGGRLIDPQSGTDTVADLWVDGDRIAGIGRKPAGYGAPAREIDARERVVCPGFVEIGARLREPGAEHKASIASELEAAAAGGFTTVCCTPDTNPVIDTPAVVELINQRARGVRGARVLALGALTRGLGGEVLAEMRALQAIGCVGVTNAGHAIRDTGVLKNALAYASTLGLTVFLDAEDPWLGAQGVMHEGANSTRMGLPGVPAAAELIGLARELVLVAETGARAHFRTLSCAGSIKYLREARKAGLAISADVGIAHLHLTDADVRAHDAACHVRPPLREARDREALRRGLARGQLDILSAHHQPHDADAKAAPFAASAPGISGLDGFLPLLLELVETGVMDLARAIACCALAPARLLGLDSGSLGPGSLADVIVFDPRHTWTLDTASMRSQGHNTPFLGRPLRGRVTHTLVGGRLVHELDA